jgi:glyoxylase-like metal-dependent hydrolase (beta-lactamase superfamily II)
MTNLSWQIGDVRVTRIVEVLAPLPPGELLPDATPERLAPYREWLVPDFMSEEGQFLLSIHALVLETHGAKILVDTCVGQHAIPGFEGLLDGASPLPEALAAAGHPRESIDVVLCTHLHFDHVGWNTMQQGDAWVPTFPNARYLFARKEWEHWKNEESEFATTLDDAVRPVIDAGLADLVDTDHRICDEVRLVPTHGHTPGHVSVAIESQGDRALVTGDATHHPVQWAEPDWGMGADSDGPAAAATRKRMTADYGDRDVLVIGTHYAGRGAGHVVRDGDGWRFRVKA